MDTRTYLFASIIYLLIGNSACMTYKPESDLKHSLGEIAADGPSFLWHEVPRDEMAAFVKIQWGASDILPETSPIFLRMQEIVERIDIAARAADPYGMRLIPKPKVVILNSDEFNAYVTSRKLCVKQPLEISNGNDSLNPSPPSNDSQNVMTAVSLAYPGEFTENAVGTSQHACVLVEGEKNGWNVQEFVKLYNHQLPPDRKKCSLELRQNTIVIPEKDCGWFSKRNYEYIEYAAAANTIFFFTKLLKLFDEVQVATVAAHELAHYYRGHATYKNFSPYFFQQSKNNELRKPISTNHNESLQNEMLNYSSLSARPKVTTAKFSPDLIPGLKGLENFFEILCIDTHPCANFFAELQKLKIQDEYFKLEDLLYENPSPEMRKFYLAYEEAIIKIAEKIQIQGLSGSYRGIVESHFANIKQLSKDFSLNDNQRDLGEFLIQADKAVFLAISNMKTPFIEGAKQNLGFYSTEEEADEIGMELAARVGISGQRGPSLFQTFHSEILKIDPFEDSRATTKNECSEFRRTGWVQDGASVSNKLLIDSLGNIHHGLCYREFNALREWQAHNLDRLHNDSLTLIFDPEVWKRTIASMPPVQNAKSTSTQNGSSLTAAKLSVRNFEKPYCVFHPHNVH